MLNTEFKEVGKALFTRGLVSSHSGNLSVRLNDEKMLITRRGSQLGALQDQDLIETGIDKNDLKTPLASVELPVHRAILQHTAAGAVVHAHPPHAIALSMNETEIPTEQFEAYELGTVPVLGWNQDVRPGCLGDAIAEALKTHKIILVYGHGTFAVGQILEEAYKYTAALEEVCQVQWLVKTLRKSR
ncbi:aldolase [Dehalogenimonas sp. 4OHTPN]|uniref:Aldolase n=1 Tax=Dehalogenimonas sp. 4OHTPN TaxID=3166643 RepID=A0AAU8G9L5_9CHLR